MQFTHELHVKEISPLVLFGEWGDSYLVLTDTRFVIAEFDLDAVRCVAITSHELHVITDSRFCYSVDGNLVKGSQLLQPQEGSPQFLLTVSLLNGEVVDLSKLDSLVSSNSDASKQQLAGLTHWQTPSELVGPSRAAFVMLGGAGMCAAVLAVIAAFVFIGRERRTRRVS